MTSRCLEGPKVSGGGKMKPKDGRLGDTRWLQEIAYKSLDKVEFGRAQGGLQASGDGEEKKEKRIPRSFFQLVDEVPLSTTPPLLLRRLATDRSFLTRYAELGGCERGGRREKVVGVSWAFD